MSLKVKFSDTATVGKLSLGLLLHAVVMAASGMIWFDHKFIKLETVANDQIEMKQDIRRIDTEGSLIWKNTHPLEEENAKRVEARLDRIEDKMDSLSVNVTRALNRRTP